ncbi:MAG TPA: hypothetical protein VHS59_08600 [Bacillota bacterium]|nr:hypothetical protein [Bacillota bacterium]
MRDYLNENPGIKLLVNLILGIILFKFLFSLVFGGASGGTVQGLINLVLQLVKVLIVLALVAGSMVLAHKLLSGKSLSIQQFTPEQIFKGVVLGVLGLAAFYLLSGMAGGSTGGYYMGGYYSGGYGHGYLVNQNSFNVNGLFTGLLSLVMNLLGLALVIFLLLGSFQAAKPYLEKEFPDIFNALKTKSQPPATADTATAEPPTAD